MERSDKRKYLSFEILIFETRYGKNKEGWRRSPALYYPRGNASFLHKKLHYDFRRIGDRGAGAEDGGDAGFVEEVIILCGDDTTCGDHDVGSAEFSSELACNVSKNLVLRVSCRSSSSQIKISLC